MSRVAGTGGSGLRVRSIRALASLWCLLARTFLGPPRLGGPSQRLAAFFGTDVAPTRGAETDGGPVNRRGRQASRSNIKHLNRKIEQGLGWESSLSHDALQAYRAARSEQARQLVI